MFYFFATNYSWKLELNMLGIGYLYLWMAFFPQKRDLNHVNRIGHM